MNQFPANPLLLLSPSSVGLLISRLHFLDLLLIPILDILYRIHGAMSSGVGIICLRTSGAEVLELSFLPSPCKCRT